MMGKRFGLVHVLATVLLLWSPSLVFAAPATSDAAPKVAKATATKADTTCGKNMSLDAVLADTHEFSVLAQQF